MNFNIEDLKKRIIYRSKYRGTKEMDTLLNTFINKNIDLFDSKDLFDLEKFLDIDDEKIYNFYNGMEEGLNFQNDRILKAFKNFKLNK